MSSTLTVFSPRPFTDGRALPEAAKWRPTNAGFEYESQSWRITVQTSVAVDPSLIPAAAKAIGRDVLFATDVTLTPDSVPAAVRELFEYTARQIAINTRGSAVGAPGSLAPRRVRRPAPDAETSLPSRGAVELELMKAEGMLHGGIDRPRSPTRRFAVLVSVFGVVALFVAEWSTFTRWQRRHPESSEEVPDELRLPFDATAWKRAGQGENSGRLKMVDDLIERRLLIGLTEDEVVNLLGVPADPKATGTDRLSTSFSPTDRVFRLGWLGRLPLNRGAFALVVHFDGGGLATEAEVIR